MKLRSDFLTSFSPAKRTQFQMPQQSQSHRTLAVSQMKTVTKMNQKILALLVLSTIFSCENSKTSSLEKRITELETINKDLEKKLTEADYHKISASQINLFPDNVFVKIGEKIKVTGKFFEDNTLPKYNLYETDSTFSKSSRKILFENITDPSFEIIFTPKNKNQNKMYVSAEFEFNGEKFETNSLVQFVIK